MMMEAASSFCAESSRVRALKRLDDIEKKLEEATRRCESRLAVRRVASIGPGPSAAGTLRVFVYCTKASRNDKWWWELHVEGRLIDDGTDDDDDDRSCLVSRLASRGSFGNFVDRIEVVTDRKAKSALLWTPPSGVCCDGLVVRRPAHQKTHVRVSVFRKSFPTRYAMSSSLKKIVTGYRDDMTRDAVLTALSRYADRHHLRNPNDQREIFCDDLLENCFGLESFSFSQLGDLITPHLQEPEPLVIDYTIPPAGDTPNSTVKADVLVDVPLKQKKPHTAEEPLAISNNNSLLVGDLSTDGTPKDASSSSTSGVVIKGPSLELMAISRLNHYCSKHDDDEHPTSLNANYAKLYSTLNTAAPPSQPSPALPQTTTTTPAQQSTHM